MAIAGAGCLAGIGIVFGGVAPHDAAALADVVTSLGGTIWTPEDAAHATFLVASTVLPVGDADPYLVAKKANRALAAVTPEWLQRCKEGEAQVDPAPHLLGPFTGVHISVTGVQGKTRAELMNMLQCGGAMCKADLHRSMTHLVGDKPGTPKHNAAKGWKLKSVHLDWVLHSMQLQTRLDEQLYDLDTYRPAPGAAATTETVTPAASGVNAASKSATRTTSLARSASGPGPGPGAAAAPRGPAGPPAGSAYGVLPAAPPPAAPPFTVPEGPQSDECYFMPFVTLHAVGQTEAEATFVRQAVCECGASRQPELCPGVTHVLVGSQPTVAELTAVREFVAEHGREQVHVVYQSWLYECVMARSYLQPEVPAYAVPAAALTPGSGSSAGGGGGGAGGAGAAQPAKSALSARYPSREGSPLPGAAAADDQQPVPLDPEGQVTTMDSLALRGPPGAGAAAAGREGGAAAAACDVFSGLWFTLAAVEGTEEAGAATKLIRQGKGMIVTAGAERLVGDASRRYAVCPFGLPPAAVERLCARARGAGPTEFERVPVDHRITLRWLADCVREAKLVPVRHDTPLFRPLPHALPLAAFSGVKVASSQLDPEQRALLRALFESLGGTFSEALNRRCHYLIIPSASGDKFEAALKWSIPCVSTNWVLQSAVAGRPLDDPAVLRACLPSGITAEELEERRRAVQARRGGGGGGGGGRASQAVGYALGPTQHPGGGGGGTQAPAPASSALRGTQYAPAQQAPEALPPPGAAQTQVQTQAGRPPPPPAAAAAAAAAVAIPGPPMPAAAPAAAAAVPSRPAMQPLLESILNCGDQDDDDDVPMTTTAAGAAATAAVANGPPRGAGAGAGGADDGGGGAAAEARALAALRAVSSPAPPPPAAPPSLRPEAAVGTALQADTDAPAAPQLAPPQPRPPLPDAALLELAPAPAPAPAAAPLAPMSPPPPPPLAAPHDDNPAAAANLMQFLNLTKAMLAPEFNMCSQVDLPVPSGVEGGEGSGGGGPGEASAQLGTAGLGFADADAAAAAAAGGGRRSRKRPAVAAAADTPAPAERLGVLPGRRGHADEDLEGFGMSQQVGYDAASDMPPPPPRTTRSSARGADGPKKTTQGGRR